MQPRVIIYTIVKDGKLLPDATKRILTEIKKWEGEKITIKINKYFPNRSLEQNNTLHAWIDILADHTGYEAWEMKNILKELFLSYEKVNEATGTIMRCVYDTHTLDTAKMAWFMDKVFVFAQMEFSCTLPQPDKKHRQLGMSFKNKDK
jgi:hypothetical protein